MAVYRIQDSMNLHVEEKVVSAGLESTALPNDIKGVTKSEQDILMDDGKGPVLKSPNGHRMRLIVSNLGVVSAFDLDA